MSERRQLAAIAAKVAQKWGVEVPFPPAHVTDRWLKYKTYAHLIGASKRDLEYDIENNLPGHAKRARESIAHRTKQRDRLKVPEPYPSWEHIADFHETEPRQS